MRKFMQANFRFSILESALEDFHASQHIGAAALLEEADRSAHWQDVASVHHTAPDSDPVRCPICLESPIAAKITKCGHIFCWPCILHYLALSENNWRRCPLCFHSVYAEDLKSVCLTIAVAPKAGEFMTFSFLHKVKGSVAPVAISQPLPPPSTLLPCDHPAAVFSKHTVATKDHLAALDQEHREQLQAAYQSEDEASGVFISQALCLLGDDPVPVPVPAASPTSSPSTVCYVEWPAMPSAPLPCKGALVEEENEEAASPPVDESLAFPAPSDPQASTAPLAVEAVEAVDGKMSAQPGSKGPGSKGRKGPIVQSFYQCEDGRAIFLHPFSCKMLLHHASLASSPEALRVQVTSAENHTLSEELRKRHTILRHLPLGSTFTFCEVDLVPVVGAATMEHFADEIKARVKQRKTQALRQRREQEKRDSAAMAEGGQYAIEAAACGMAPVYLEEAPDLEAASLFPSLSSTPAAIDTLTSAEIAEAVPSSPLASSVSPPLGASFAALTRDGYAAANDRSDMPVLGGGLSRVSSSPKGVWGGAGTAPSSLVLSRSSSAPAGTPRQANFAGDDEVPAEFRHSGGPSGLGDFLIQGGNSKQGKKKGKKKKQAEADNMDMDTMFM